MTHSVYQARNASFLNVTSVFLYFWTNFPPKLYINSFWNVCLLIGFIIGPLTPDALPEIKTFFSDLSHSLLTRKSCWRVPTTVTWKYTTCELKQFLFKSSKQSFESSCKTVPEELKHFQSFAWNIWAFIFILGQFHHHFMSGFCASIFTPNLLANGTEHTK